MNSFAAQRWLCVSFIFTLPLFAWEKATRGQAITEETLAVAALSHHSKLQQKIKRQLIWSCRGNQVYSHDNLHRSSINRGDQNNYLQLRVFAKYKRISKSCWGDADRIETITKTNKQLQTACTLTFWSRRLSFILITLSTAAAQRAASTSAETFGNKKGEKSQTYSFRSQWVEKKVWGVSQQCSGRV